MTTTDRTVLVRLKAHVGDFVAGMSTARAAVKGVTSEIDTSNDRVAWLSQSILAIGPALVPLGAAAVPVFSGIATQATIAAGAVGVAVLAFHGVGTALKAVNDYQAKPTIENFQKMQEVLTQLGPDGAQFVATLDALTPQLRSLQATAREGMFPGAETGLTAMLQLMPRVRGLIAELASAMGQLMAEAGQNIGGGGLESFFQFLDRNARPILLDMGHTIGNFAEGMINLLAAFEPLSQGFSHGLLDMARSFNDWSKGLDENAGFQDFVSYVQESVPKAVNFLAALAHAFVAIITAAAPVGDVMLPLLTDLLDVIAALADSPLGPIFLSAAAAMSIYGRAVAIASVTTGGLGKGLGTLGLNALKGSGSIRTLSADLKLMSLQYSRVGRIQSTVLSGMSQTTGAAQRARGSIMAIGRAGLLLGGLALSTSSVAQNMGIANTATYALMGAMIGGVPGAVGGGVVGAIVDFTNASGKAGQSQKQLQQDIRAAGTDMTKYGQAVDDAFGRLAAHEKDVHSSNFGEFLSNSFDPDVWSEFTKKAWGATTATEQMTKDAAAAKEQYGGLQVAAQLLAFRLGDTGDKVTVFGQNIAKKGVVSLDDMTWALNQAQPAMAALGITTDDLIAAAKDGSIGHLVNQLTHWQSAADSTAGRTKGVIKAVDGLDNALSSTADTATQLEQALDALFNPKISLSAALDNWTVGIRQLNKDLAKNNKTLEGNSKAALQNRDVIRDRVSRMLDVLKAEADSGASAQRLTHTLKSQRDQLVNAAGALGMNTDQLKKYLTQLGLTPRLVNTLIKNNAPEAKNQVDQLNAALNGLNGKTVKSYVEIHTIHTGGTSGDLPAAHGGSPRAGGGLVTGPGGPRDDKIPAWLSNREYVLKADAVAKYGVGLFEKYNRLGFADGGYALYSRTRGADAPPGADSHHYPNTIMLQADLVGKSLKELKKALDEATKTVTKEKAARDAVLEKMTSLSGTVSSGLRSDIFAGPTTNNPWAPASASNPNGILSSDIARANEETQLIKTLQGKGLTGDALAEVLSKQDINLLRAYAAMDPATLAQYTALFNQREKALATVSAAAGQAAYGTELSGAQSELRQANRELHAIKQAIDAMDKHNQAGHKGTTDATGHGKDAPAKGRRRARRP